MSIYLGDIEIPENTDGFYVGENPVSQVYVGTTLVWSRTLIPTITLDSNTPGLTNIQLFWTLGGGATESVTIEWGTTSSYGNMDTVNFAAGNYNIGSLIQNTNYFWRVTATNSAGAMSIMGSAMTGISDPIPIYSNVIFSDITDEAITISWDITNDVDTQTLRFGDNISVLTGTGGDVFSIGPGARTATRIGLDHDTVYYFRLEAVNAGGTGFTAAQQTTTLDAFEFFDGFVDGSFVIDEMGVPSGTLQNGATDIEFDLPVYPLSSTDIFRGCTVSFMVPSGFSNSGERLAMLLTATQPGTAIPATSGTLGNFVPGIVDIPAAGENGTHSITVLPTGASWEVVGTNGMTIDRSGAGDRTGVGWNVGATTVARAGTITLRSSNGDLHVLDWNQLNPPVNATTGSIDFPFLFMGQLFALNGLGDLNWELTIEANGLWMIDTDLTGAQFDIDNGDGDAVINLTYTDGDAVAGLYEVNLRGMNGNLLSTIEINLLF